MSVGRIPSSGYCGTLHADQNKICCILIQTNKLKLRSTRNVVLIKTFIILFGGTGWGYISLKSLDPRLGSHISRGSANM